MNYEKKYNKLVEAIKVLQETNPSDEGIQNWVYEELFKRFREENPTWLAYLTNHTYYEIMDWYDAVHGLMDDLADLILIKCGTHLSIGLSNGMMNKNY